MNTSSDMCVGIVTAAGAETEMVGGTSAGGGGAPRDAVEGGTKTVATGTVRGVSSASGALLAACGAGGVGEATCGSGREAVSLVRARAVLLGVGIWAGRIFWRFLVGEEEREDAEAPDEWRAERRRVEDAVDRVVVIDEDGAVSS